MKDRDPHMKLVRSGSQVPELPHEQLDVYDVLEEAYRTITGWQGISWSKGTIGDPVRVNDYETVLHRLY